LYMPPTGFRPRRLRNRTSQCYMPPFMFADAFLWCDIAIASEAISQAFFITGLHYRNIMFYHISRFPANHCFTAKTFLLPQIHAFPQYFPLSQNPSQAFITYHNRAKVKAQNPFPFVDAICRSHDHRPIAPLIQRPFSHCISQNPSPLKPSPMRYCDQWCDITITHHCCTHMLSPLSPHSPLMRYCDLFAAVGSALARSNDPHSISPIFLKNDRSRPTKHHFPV